MAEQAYSVVVDKVNFKVIKWTDIINGNTGVWYPWSYHYPDKCVHIIGGPWGAAGSCTMQGTCEDGVPAKPLPLCDAQGNAITKTADAIEQVLESPTQIRPAVTAGDATTKVTVYLTMRG